MGSSPLARGLPGQCCAHGECSGIIPARAGFTTPTPRRMMRTRDHPRSRGVYGVPCAAGGVSGGSSPLARGLPSCPIRALISLGIIPARAGFTWRGRSRGGFESDHPRSRGVYRARARAFMPRLGSSPLARGLRIHLAYANQSRRIIPARAGFTSAGERPACRARDHPRSRGVYLSLRQREGPGAGSSPLARGLQGGEALGNHRLRIIPARAGFT